MCVCVCVCIARMRIPYTLPCVGGTLQTHSHTFCHLSSVCVYVYAPGLPSHVWILSNHICTFEKLDYCSLNSMPFLLYLTC